jgi:hypothetical protein
MNIAAVVKLDGITYQVRGWYQPKERQTNDYPGCDASLEISEVFVGNDDQDVIEHLSEDVVSRLEEKALEEQGSVTEDPLEWSRKHGLEEF